MVPPAHLLTLPQAHPSFAFICCFLVLLFSTSHPSLHTCLLLTVTSCGHVLFVLHLCSASSTDSFEKDPKDNTAVLLLCYWLPRLSLYLNWHLLYEVFGLLEHLCPGSSDEALGLSPSALQKHVWKNKVY